METGSLIVALLVALTCVVERSESAGAVTMKLGKGHKPEATANLEESMLTANPGRKGQVVLKNIQNVYYTGIIKVGSTGVEMPVIFDSGSPDLWLSSVYLCGKHSSYCSSHATYDHTKSKTYKKDGRQFLIDYLVGTIQGVVVVDDISVAGIKVTEQVFGEATLIDAQSLTSQYSGIFGLGLAAGSSYPADPPFVNMVNRKLLAEPVFAFYLSKNNAAESELALGGVDSTRYTGEFTFTPVIARDQWLIKMDKLYVNKNQIVGEYGAMPDSGTEKIFGPPFIIDAINERIGKADKDGVVYLDCNKLGGLPIVSFVINKRLFAMKSEDYVSKTVGADNKVTCTSGFESSGALDYVILGESFMRAVYVQFNMGKNQIGFATAK